MNLRILVETMRTPDVVVRTNAILSIEQTSFGFHCLYRSGRKRWKPGEIGIRKIIFCVGYIKVASARAGVAIYTAYEAIVE